MVASLGNVRNRREEGCFVAEGTKCVIDTWNSFKCKYLFATTAWIEQYGKELPNAQPIVVKRADMERITEGITLEDGEIFADEVAYVDESKKEVGIEIHSGRNRIVRRIFEHLGYAVQKLDRVYYAGITKKNLKRGAWRFLTKDEVDRLKSGRYE